MTDSDDGKPGTETPATSKPGTEKPGTETADARTSEKRKRLDDALNRGMVQVHLDARRPGVAVPERFATEHHLVLNISYRFSPPDLTVNEWGVRQTLSFGGSSFPVALPWNSIYAVASYVTREFFMYPEDMPLEITDSVGGVENVTADDLATVQTKPPAPAPAPRAALREVVIDRSAEEPGDPPSEPTPPKRGHLRVVK